jgi:hypothetical protein
MGFNASGGSVSKMGMCDRVGRTEFQLLVVCFRCLVSSISVSCFLLVSLSSRIPSAFFPFQRPLLPGFNVSSILLTFSRQPPALSLSCTYLSPRVLCEELVIASSQRTAAERLFSEVCCIFCMNGIPKVLEGLFEESWMRDGCSSCSYISRGSPQCK